MIKRFKTNQCKTHNLKAINPHESALDLDRRGNQVLEQISPH